MTVPNATNEIPKQYTEFGGPTVNHPKDVAAGLRQPLILGATGVRCLPLNQCLVEIGAPPTAFLFDGRGGENLCLFCCLNCSASYQATQQRAPVRTAGSFRCQV